MAFPYKLKWEKGRFSKTQKDPYVISRSKVERFQVFVACALGRELAVGDS